MDVNGKHEFKISRGELWAYLMDPIVLAKITPGISKLEHIEDDQYKSVSNIKIGPVKGSFTGKLSVENKNEPKTFDIKMEQLSKIGNAHATIKMNIEENEIDGCTLLFDGKAKLSGTIARTGQRVLSGVANKLTKEVFTALEKHIEETNETSLDSALKVRAEGKESEIDKAQEIYFLERIVNFFKNIFRA